MAEGRRIKGHQESDLTVITGKLEPLLNWSQSIRALGADNMSIYRAEMSRALSEYSLGHLEETKAILSKLLANLGQLLASPFEEIKPELHLLYAQAQAAVGRTSERLGQNKESQIAFKKAAKEFSTWLPQAQGPIDQLYCDYGVSLFKSGASEKRTLEAFERAERAGLLNAEAHRYMGTCLMQLKRFKEAKAHFDAALKQDPNDFLTYKALGECLERQKKISAAVSEYYNAASILDSSGLADEAVSLLDHATKLAPKDPLPLVLKGDILGAQGRYLEALEALDEGLKRQPHNALALGIKGQTLLSLERYKEAVDCLQQALTLDPSLDWVATDLATSLINLSEYKRALQVLNKALAKWPHNADALIFKGGTLSQLGKHQQALAVLNKALKLYPNDQRALWLKGGVLIELNQYKRAVQALQRCLKLDPTRPEVYVDLAAALDSLEQYDAALDQLNKALAIKPDYTQALRGKGDILHMLDRNEEALQVLNLVLTLSPKDSWALGTKGQVLLSLERTGEAVKILQQAVEIDPALAWAQAELGSALYSLGRYKEALQAFNEALRVQPASSNWLIFKGLVLSDIAEFQDAAKALEQATRLDPHSAQAFGYKGWALENLGAKRANDALKAYEAAARLEPKNLWWRQGIANSLYLKRDMEKALQEYKRVSAQAQKLIKKEQDADIISLTGWCQYRLGDFEKAVHLFYEALTLNPDKVSNRFDLALSLACSGHYDEALSEYHQAIRTALGMPPLRLRGLAFVALDDLNLAIKLQPDLAIAPPVNEMVSLLKAAYDTQTKYMSAVP